METVDAKLPDMLERHLGPRTQVWFERRRRANGRDRIEAGEVADSTVVYIRFSGTFPELKHRCRYFKERTADWQSCKSAWRAWHGSSSSRASRKYLIATKRYH